MAHFSDVERHFRVRQMRNIVVGFMAVAAFIVLATGLAAMSERQMAWVAHTFQVKRQITQVSLAAARLSAGPAYPQHLLPIERDRLNAAIGEIARITADNPAQQARVARLRALERQLLERIAVVPGPAAAGAAGAASADTAYPAAAVDRVAAAMQDEEDRLLAARTARLKALQLVFYVLVGLAATAICVLAALTYSSLWTFTQDIIASRRALRAINQDLERAVAERTEELTHANDELRRFAFIVSHDLRAPLVNIMGFAGELETVAQRLTDILNAARQTRPDSIYPDTDTLIERDLPEAIHFIGASTRKMERLVNAILQLSRQNSRRLLPQWLDMNAVVAGIIASMQTIVEQAGARIEVAADLPDLHCDRTAVEQVLSNLIENAVKYAHPDRPPVVQVTGRRLGEMAEFRVTDNGRGIASADLDHVFELFRRSGPRDRPGEGIGLANVRTAIHQLGGTITLQSELATGSTFVFTIPLRSAPEQGAGGMTPPHAHRAAVAG